MRKVLIGVVFVVALGVAGYVGMVIGRVMADVPIATAVPITVIDASPTTGMLVLPTVAAPTNTLEPSAAALLTAVLSDVVPTPEAECVTQDVRLSEGEQYVLVLDSTKSIWYVDTVGNSVFSPVILGPLNIGGHVFDVFGIPPYQLYDSYKSTDGQYSIPAGTYSVGLDPSFKFEQPIEYVIYICPANTD